MRYLLVDGNNLLMRALFATQHATMSAQGVKTGALQVFISTLAKHIREETPTHVGVAWDAPRSDLRTALDPTYKATRNVSLDPHVKRNSFLLAEAFCVRAGIDSYHHAGVEADDIIASWWHDLIAQRPPNMGSIVILSSDKDFLQLLGTNPTGMITEQLRLSSANTLTDRWSHVRVKEEFGCTPRRLPYLMAIMGDKVDNVVGVPGVGPKKGVRRLEEHDWLFPAAAASYGEHEERLLKNLELVNLRNVSLNIPAPAPFHPVEPGSPRYEELKAFCDNYELVGIATRLASRSLWTDRWQGRSTLFE
jgi:DNA polymerase I